MYKSPREAMAARWAITYAQLIICVSVVTMFVQLVDKTDTMHTNTVHFMSIYVSVVGSLFLVYLFLSIMRYEKKRIVSVKSGQDVVLSHSAEGMNKFLMLGTVVFGLGTILLDIFRLTKFAESPRAWVCEGWAYFVASIFRIIFNLLVLAFLLLHHQIIINYNTSLMRLGFIHLIAANVANWASTVILESSYAFRNHPAHELSTNGSMADFAQSHEPKEEELVSVHGKCHRKAAIFDEAGDYLFAFVIEFALIAATMFYKIHGNIGGSAEIHHMEEPPVRNVRTCLQVVGGMKGIVSIIITVLVFIATVVGVIYFCLYKQHIIPHGRDRATVIYLASDIALNIIGLIGCVVTIHRIRKLVFTKKEDKLNFDELLLSVSMFGFLFLLTFRSAVEIHGARHDGLVAGLLASSILNIFQSFVQVGVIRDGLYRHARSKHQLEKKRGRRHLTGLIVINLAMWLVNTFELKEIYEGHIYINVLGPLEWMVIVHIFLPLAIFFRFHSAVCLTDVWVEAYKPAPCMEEQSNPHSTKHAIQQPWSLTEANGNIAHQNNNPKVIATMKF